MVKTICSSALKQTKGKNCNFFSAFVLASVSILSACSNPTESPQADINGEQMIAPLPEGISALAYDKNNLHVTVILTSKNGNTQNYPLSITSVDTNEVRGNLNTSFPPGDYSMSLIYSAEHPPYGLLELMELGVVNITVKAGGHSIADFRGTTPVYTDSDDDGFSNLIELSDANNTNPLDSLVFPGHTFRPPHSPKVTIASADSATVPQYRMTVEWTNLVSASSYNVYMSGNPGVTPATAQTTITGQVSPYSYPQTITDNESLYIAVTRVAGGQESLAAAELYVQGGALASAGKPPSLTAEAGEGEITLSWESRTAGEARYTVYWSDSLEFRSNQAFTDITTTSFTHGNLKNGHMYYYYVSAIDALGTSQTSIVGATPYGRFAGLTAGEITLTKAASPDGTPSVQIEIAPNPNVRDVTVYTAADPTLTKDNYQQLGGQQYNGLTSPMIISKLPSDRLSYFRLVLYDRYGRAGDESQLVGFDPRI